MLITYLSTTGNTLALALNNKDYKVHHSYQFIYNNNYTSLDIADTVIPPNTAVLGTGEKPVVFPNGGIGREYNLKNPY